MRPFLLHHLLEESAQRAPEAIALRYEGRTLSYAELARRVMALGSLLCELGVGRGDRIAILLNKSFEQVIAILGTLQADGVFVVINPLLHPSQIDHILVDSGARLLITSRENPSWAAAAERRSVTALFVEDWDRLAEGHWPTRESRNISDDMAAIIYTSGSTGLPKGIVITHRNLLDGARIVSSYLELTSQDVLLGLLPFNFDYGLNQLTTSLLVGATLVLFHYTMPNELLRTLHRERITGLAVIPPVLSAMFNPRLCRFTPDLDFSSLRYITNSGGKVPVPIVRKVRQTFPHVKLYLMYGLTEAFRSTYLPPEEVDRRPDSIGKAIPNVEVEVIDAEGRPCAPGEVGELIHRGACIARGYWNNPEKTREVYRPNPLLPPENRFLETVVYSGDLVRKDEEGFLYFVGRRDSMIKTNGYRVSPTEVEELLIATGLVAEAVAFGAEDEEIGQKIIAAVTLTGNAKPEEILGAFRSRAPHYMVPRALHIQDRFPKTATGKIDRPAVIQALRESHGY